MSFRSWLTSAALLLCSSLLVSTHPLAGLWNGSVTTLHSDSLNTKASISPSASLSEPPSHEITCFHPATGLSHTTLETCLPSLTTLGQFPNSRQIQQFLSYRYPEKPYPPPLTVWEPGSTCAIRIAATDPDLVDYFSFNQVRRLATEILGVCRDDGGVGGSAPLGNELGWSVQVIGTMPVGDAGARYLRSEGWNSSVADDGTGRVSIV